MLQSFCNVRILSKTPYRTGQDPSPWGVAFVQLSYTSLVLVTWVSKKPTHLRFDLYLFVFIGALAHDVSEFWYLDTASPYVFSNLCLEGWTSSHR